LFEFTRAFITMVMVMPWIVSAAGPSRLQRVLERMSAGHAGMIAFYAKNLSDGRTVALASDVPVKTASVIKLALFLEAFRQVDAGVHRLDETVTLDSVNRVAGDGVLGFLRPGLTLTVDDALFLMMALSDNTATNLLIDRFGVDSVNENSKRLGVTQTHLYKKVLVPASHPMPADQKQFGLGKTTARERQP